MPVQYPSIDDMQRAKSKRRFTDALACGIRKIFFLDVERWRRAKDRPVPRRPLHGGAHAYKGRVRR